jgi:hypothetical protein
MAIKLGMDAKLYYGTAGTTAASIINNVKDVTLNLSTQETDVTTRGNGGWVATQATLKEGSLDFSMIWDTDDAAFTAIQTAFFANNSIAFLVLDEESGQGLDADFSITNFTRNEALTDAITVDVTAKPAYSTRAPEWVSGS